MPATERVERELCLLDLEKHGMEVRSYPKYFCFTVDQLATETRREQQRVEINYDKLRELCLQEGDERDGGGEHAGSANREQR